MSGSANGILFATICNTVGEASAYSLWFAAGARQFVVDLSGHLNDASGLTGIAYHMPAGCVLSLSADRTIPAEPGLFACYFYTSLITAHVRASEAATA